MPISPDHIGIEKRLSVAAYGIKRYPALQTRPFTSAEAKLPHWGGRAANTQLTSLHPRDDLFLLYKLWSQAASEVAIPIGFGKPDGARYGIVLIAGEVGGGEAVLPECGTDLSDCPASALIGPQS